MMQMGFPSQAMNYATILFVLLTKKFISGEITEEIKKAATTEEGEKWCPVRLAGTQCPPSSIFHYYKCCGNLNNECCFNIQSWIIIGLIALGVVFLASILVSILKCVFCRRK